MKSLSQSKTPSHIALAADSPRVFVTLKDSGEVQQTFNLAERA